MSRSERLNMWVRMVALLVLGAVFGWSGLVKIFDPESFVLIVYRYHLVPGPAVNLVALWVAMLEFTCAAALLFFPRMRLSALWMIMGLLSVFSVILIIRMAGGASMACGCFSTSPLAKVMGWERLAGNVVLLMLTVLLIRMSAGKRGTGAGC